MKNSNKIVSIWICVIIVLASVWGVLIYSIAQQGGIRLKETAVETLREVATQVVNLEFDKLEIPQYGSQKKKKHTTRRTTATDGIIEVLIDSLKEEQGLYSLGTVGYKANVLHCINKYPLEQIGNKWQTEMEKKYNGIACSLSLKINTSGKKIVHGAFVGDTTICTSQHEIGVFYLDDMYTMTLAAYIETAFGNCIDCTSHWLLIVSCLLFLLLLGLPIWIILQRYKNRELVETLTEEIYHFGKYSFNAVQHTLLYEEKEISNCTSQEAKLLLAFAKAQDFIVTNDEIAIACGWPLDEKGIDVRRRKIISLLRNLFSADDSVKIVALDKKSGYQLLISQ